MSRLIKSQYAKKDDQDKQQITLRTIHVFQNDGLREDTPDPELTKEAAMIIEAAKQEAEKIIQAAQLEKNSISQQIMNEKESWAQERELLIEQAQQEGYAEGLELGRQEALRQYDAYIEESKQIVNMAKNDYEEIVQEAEDTILSLSIELAGKVLATKLADSPENFLPLVKQGLTEVKEHENIKIHVHPQFYEFVLSQKDELRLLLTNNSEIYIYPNSELNETDCFIESDYGRIDISIDTQLEQLKKQLLNLLNER